jgi:hypothetical protein
MGSWGYTPLENDAALDIQHLWESKVEGWAEDRGWQPKDIAAHFIDEYWGETVRYGDNITNAEIIALVELFRFKGFGIPDNLKKVAELAINRELVEEELQEWEDPEARKKALLDVLNFIGGTIKAPRKVKSFNDPAVHYKNTASAVQSLNRLIEFCCRPGGYYGPFYWLKYPSFPGVATEDAEEIKRIDRKKLDLPDFMRILDRFMLHGLWEKDSNLSMQAGKERRMMLATYLGIAAGLSAEETKELVERVS